ncbi:Caspase domain-containing protein [Cladophialophora immunda]|nr:Caspase domain-containing protein [Cladophialophora immunda]
MPNKKALLIASPFGRLKGPLRDVEMVVGVLRTLGFDTAECCGADATRDGILQAWRQLIDSIHQGDCVVIYYSGHGGMVESLRDQPRDISNLGATQPWRYQFIVPMDFEDTTAKGDFGGILDIELSCLVWEMTAKTKNATIILDCCYAGHMVRDPDFGASATARSLSEVQYHDVSKYVDRLKHLDQVRTETEAEGNPWAIRIAAAAANETAWEYQNAEGEWRGAMTEALVLAMAEGSASGISWWTTMLRVKELVNVRFPYQHPRADGPVNRHRFSLQESISGTYHIRNEADGAVIQAGRVSGVNQGNVYAVMPLGAKEILAEEQLAEAHITEVTAFKATTRLSFTGSQATRLPDEGAMAFIRHETLPKWPVTLPTGLPWLDDMVQGSRFIRRRELDENDFTLAEFCHEANDIVLRSHHGLAVTATPSTPSEEEVAQLLKSAEQLARAQHLLSLEHEATDEILQHRVEVTVQLVGDQSSPGRVLGQDGAGSLTEGDRIVISLLNDGYETVYVSVFDINAVGKISLVSRSSGIELPQGRREVLGRSLHGFTLPGLKVSWPRGICHAKPLRETLLLFLSSEPVDLRHLADPARPAPAERTSLSKLEQLTWSISTGCSRKAEAVDDDDLRYSTIRIPFLLRPNDVD